MDLRMKRMMKVWKRREIVETVEEVIRGLNATGVGYWETCVKRKAGAARVHGCRGDEKVEW